MTTHDPTIDGLQARDPTLLKVGGVMTVLGTVMAALGNVMHPRSTGYYDDPVAWLDHNTESSIWFGSHVLILLGTIVLIGPMVVLARSLAGTRGHGLGYIALANAIVGMTVMTVLLAIDGLVVAELSDVWVAHASHSADSVLTATILYYTIFNLLYVSMITFFGLAPIFYGFALLVSRTFPRWFNWIGIAVGTSVVINAVLSMVDVNREFLDAKVWAVTSTLVVFWFFAIGIMLWRSVSSRAGTRSIPSGEDHPAALAQH
jgi:hypothetical protein